MKIKVDTKEKLSVLRLQETLFSENMAEELFIVAANLLQQPHKNMVVDFANVTAAEQTALPALADLYQKATENNASFVLCNINAPIKKLLHKLDLSDVLNTAPTESEACDMVHMEEMEREMWSNSAS